ncbi:hypothetical protein JYT83_01440 [bacterium AH-315-F18]|nr:hypothetical protein [bacterium AH-315-F18]
MLEKIKKSSTRQDSVSLETVWFRSRYNELLYWLSTTGEVVRLQYSLSCQENEQLLELSIEFGLRVGGIDSSRRRGIGASPVVTFQTSLLKRTTVANFVSEFGRESTNVPLQVRNFFNWHTPKELK